MDIKELLRIAYEKAKESTDPSTQNCTLLIDDDSNIIIADVNRFPCGVAETEERWERPLKYEIVVHAERVVLCVAARKGIRTEGRTLVTPWFPCCPCAGTIIESGVKKIITHKQAFERAHETWTKSLQIARIILEEAGVEVIFYDGKIGVSGILFNGELWSS